MSITFPAETWAELHFWDQDDLDNFDTSSDLIPTHPVQGLLTCLAVTHRPEYLTPKFPTPTFTFTNAKGDRALSTWYLTVPVRTDRPEQQKPLNLWKMTTTVLIGALSGTRQGQEATEATQMPNPFLFEDRISWNGDVRMLRPLRDALKAAELWGNALHPDFLKAGGKSRTEAQTQARRNNFAKRRLAAQASKAANIEQLRPRVGEVLAVSRLDISDDRKAERLGIAPGSLRTTIARAHNWLSEHPAQAESA